MATHDEFQWDSGLPDHLRGETTDAVFGYDEESQMPDRLNLDITFRDEQGDEHLFRYPVNGFITTDDGETCEREDGSEKRFHKNSAPAQLVQSVLENGGEKVLGDRLGKGLTPRHAKFYVGLDMRLERVEQGAKIDGEDVTWERMFCEEFYGEVGSKKAGGAKKSAGTAKKAAAKKTKAKKAAAEDNGTVSAELMAQIDALADDSEDFHEFLTKIVEEVPEALDIEELADDLAEEDGDVWTRALARAEEG